MTTHEKVLVKAKKVIERWDNIKLKDFDPLLIERINKLYTNIESWNKN